MNTDSFVYKICPYCHVAVQLRSRASTLVDHIRDFHPTEWAKMVQCQDSVVGGRYQNQPIPSTVHRDPVPLHGGINSFAVNTRSGSEGVGSLRNVVNRRVFCCPVCRLSLELGDLPGVVADRVVGRHMLSNH